MIIAVPSVLAHTPRPATYVAPPNAASCVSISDLADDSWCRINCGAGSCPRKICACGDRAKGATSGANKGAEQAGQETSKEKGRERDRANNGSRSDQSADAVFPENWQAAEEFWPRKDPKGSAQWLAFQKKLAAEADRYKPPGGAQAAGLVLFGDSITEKLRGTGLGKLDPRSLEDDLPAVATTMIGARWPTYQLHGISGDKAYPDLLWRILKGGELSPTMAADPRLLMSLLVGANDLSGAGDQARLRKTPEATHDSVVAVARALLARSRGKLLINAILPRNDPGVLFDWSTLVPRTNEMLAHTATELKEEFGAGRVAFANCTGRPFRGADEKLVNRSRMPDGVHPNAEGWRGLFEECLAPELERLQRRAGG